MAGEIFDAAAANAAASKREALAALARGGTAERDSYLAGLKAQQADKAKVMQDILDRATQINAPEAGALQATQATPRIDARTRALEGSSSSNQALLGSIAAANRAYMDQVNAALPIVKERALMEREARLAKEAEQSGIAEIIKGLGGVGIAQGLAQTYQGDPRFEQQPGMTADENFRPMPLAPGTFPMTSTLSPRDPTREESADDFSDTVGLPRPVGRALLGAGNKPSTTEQRTQHRFDVVQRVAQHASAPTAKAFNDTIGLSKNLPDALATIDASSDKELMEDYGKLDRAALKRWITDYYRFG